MWPWSHFIGELRQERLHLVLVSYGLFYQRIFIFDMTVISRATSFNNRHFKLSLDMYFSCHFCWFVLVTPFRKIFTETEDAESTPYLFLFYKTKNTIFIDFGSESGYTNNRPTYVFFSVNVKLMKGLDFSL